MDYILKTSATLASLVLAFYPAVLWAQASGLDESTQVGRLEEPSGPRLPQSFPKRWVYLATNFNSKDPTILETAKKVVTLGRQWGLNGVVIGDPKLFKLDIPEKDGGADRARFLANLGEFMRECQSDSDKPIEVIPGLPVCSKSKAILAHDPNLAAAYAVKDALFEVNGGVARPVGDNLLNNGDFKPTEEHPDDPLWGWNRHAGDLGIVADEEAPHEGPYSAKLIADHVDDPENQRCWLFQREVVIKTNRYYHISVWVRTQSLTPARAFSVCVISTSDGRELAYFRYTPPEDPAEWHRVHVTFNSMNHDSVNVYVGLRRPAPGGFAWLDDVKLSELGPVNVLRRPGCPLKVTGMDGHTYVEGHDFERVEDPLLGRVPWLGRYDRYPKRGEGEPPEPGITIIKEEQADGTKTSRIPDGTQLKVSFYHPMVIHTWQVDTCLTEPRVFTIFEDRLRDLERGLQELDGALRMPKYYMLGIEELRSRCRCASCDARERKPGELLAENVNKFVSIVRGMRSGVEVLVWGDMFDPNHHAGENDFALEGPFSGSWKGLDNDIIVVPWHQTDVTDVKDGVAHFEELRLKQIGGPGFDGIAGDDMAGARRKVEQWLDAMGGAKGAQGLMYLSFKGLYHKHHLCTFLREMTGSTGPCPGSAPVRR